MSQTEQRTRLTDQLPDTPSQPWYPEDSYVPQTTNGFAIASLVLGLVWSMWIGSVLAVVFGYIGKSQIEASRGTQSGTGLAIAGIVLGWVGIGTLLLFITLGLFGVFDGWMMW